jgi:hypothetical protein
MSQEIKNINITDLKLDLYNLRMPKSKQGKDEKSVIEFMLLEATTLELMLAIGENDFFAGELLLVISDKLEKNKYIVIEGNRRLTAVKLLNNPKLATVRKDATIEIAENAKFKPNILPCLVFDERVEITKYLGFIHITGKKTWRLLEKARYLYDLRNQENYVNISFKEVSREIAKMIGSSTAYVKRLLISFELYKKVEDEAFYQIGDLNELHFYLDYFTDSLNKENIRNFLNIDVNSDTPISKLCVENLKKIVHWWFKKTEGQPKVYGDSEGLRLLDTVLGNANALTAFEKGATIYEAYELTNGIDSQFEKKIKDTLKAIEQADFSSNKVKNFYNELYEDLKNIRKIASKINDFKSKLEQTEDDF